MDISTFPHSKCSVSCFGYLIARNLENCVKIIQRCCKEFGANCERKGHQFKIGHVDTQKVVDPYLRSIISFM